MIDLNQEYQKALEHFKTHKSCGAAPFRDYHKLIKIVQDYEFGTVQEFGTGVGFRAILFRRINPEIIIDTFEMNRERCNLASITF